MRLWAIGTALCLCAGFQTAQALTLVANGVSAYTIVVAKDAIPPERTAATELQAHLEQVTGAKLLIVEEGAVPDTEKQICIGPTTALAKAFPGTDLAALGRDGILLKTQGDRLFLAGARPRGTLYAVYTFLEDTVGCRWWSSTESFIPKKPTLDVPSLDIAYAPKLACREAFYRDAFDGVYAARSKCNGHFESVSPEYGGHYSILGWCHTFYQLLPPEKYFAAHPEWYSEIDGKRVSEGAQLCLANEEMRAELIKNALEWIRKSPQAGIISIAQNDCGGRCTCAKCAAMEAEEEAASGPLIRFVNSVAEAIEKDYPEVLVETLAYTYTRQAPKLVKPRRNVIVRLCTIECCFSQPLETGPENAAFKRDLDAWSAIAPQLFIWDYVTNFANYILPQPNLRVLAPNIRFFVDHKAIGLFEQGDSGSACGDFVELRAWVLAHLMWDPSRDVNALIKEFLAGYYGAAEEPLRQYLDIMHDAMDASGAALRCYMPDTSSWLDIDSINAATASFADAERRVADDPVLRARVRRARLSLDHAWLQRCKALQRTAKRENKAYLGPVDPTAACEAFIQTAESFHVGCATEGRLFSDYVPSLRDRLRPAGPLPPLLKDRDENDWVLVQDNAFRLYRSGVQVSDADDPKASDGKAACMTTAHTQWAVQYSVSKEDILPGAAHCFITIRCEAKAASGPAVQVGIYDAGAKAAVAQQVLSIEQFADGAYHDIDLGVHPLTTDLYFWAAPLNNPDAVTSVCVDRFFWYAEPAAK